MVDLTRTKDCEERREGVYTRRIEYSSKRPLCTFASKWCAKGRAYSRDWAYCNTIKYTGMFAFSMFNISFTMFLEPMPTLPFHIPYLSKYNISLPQFQEKEVKVQIPQAESKISFSQEVNVAIPSQEKVKIS